MDNGAHFYKCDFQVHTPRDPGWHGVRPASEEERKAYAEEFIAACRSKELEAVAITDHHDLVFFPYIKEAAAQERDAQGNLIPEAKRIIVFPGMELTLGVPCQAILIFDANFPVDLLGTIPSAIGIDQTGATYEEHQPTNRLERFTSFKALCETLNSLEYVKGKYILLPNVSNNADSLIRDNFATHYKNMPCVGGYLDGAIDQLNAGKWAILNGKAKEWGAKRVAVIQTGDSRRRDYRDLGRAPAWIKWAVPTAEALRQACLSKESRVAHSEPRIPSVSITAINVSNSKFMGPFNQELNAQFNAIIGGRGAGKSTILEYLRWALSDQLPDYAPEGELPNYQQKRKALINNTLYDFATVVQVSFLLNGICHIVRKNASTQEMFLKIGDESFQPCQESDIRSLLPIQAYSQKQLSSVGIRIDELKRFLHSPIKHSMDEYKSSITAIISEMRSAYQMVQRRRTLNREVDLDQLELRSLEGQLSKLRSGVKGLSEEDKQSISQHSRYEQEDQIVDSWLQDIERVREALDQASISLASIPSQQPDTKEVPNSDLIGRIQSAFDVVASFAKQQIELGKDKLKPDSGDMKGLDEAVKKWTTARQAQDKKYKEALNRSSSQEAQLNRITDIEKRMKEVNKSLLKKKQEAAGVEAAEGAYGDCQRRWKQVNVERGNALEAECQKLSSSANGRISVRLKRGGGTGALRVRLKEACEGSRIKSDKIQELCERIEGAANPIEQWERVLLELEVLAHYDVERTPSLLSVPECPSLHSAGFTKGELERLARGLSAEVWLNIALTELEDIPEFSYRVREGQYIPFADASAGQQATALMHLLLNQDGPPLIIDQPEDDLDNQVIYEIVEQIWRAKEQRQLIFSSHNANIVVNGDADLVMCCDYRVAGDHSLGVIKHSGAIDVENVKNEITNVMEGGEEAFKLRYARYGY